MTTTAAVPATSAADVLDKVAEAVLAFAICDSDAAGAETAYVRVVGPTGQILDLCKHHYETHELALDFQGYTVAIDLRSSLTPASDHPSA